MNVAIGFVNRHVANQIRGKAIDAAIA